MHGSSIADHGATDGAGAARTGKGVRGHADCTHGAVTVHGQRLKVTARSMHQPGAAVRQARIGQGPPETASGVPEHANCPRRARTVQAMRLAVIARRMHHAWRGGPSQGRIERGTPFAGEGTPPPSEMTARRMHGAVNRARRDSRAHAQRMRGGLPSRASNWEHPSPGTRLPRHAKRLRDARTVHAINLGVTARRMHHARVWCAERCATRSLRTRHARPEAARRRASSRPGDASAQTGPTGKEAGRGACARADGPGGIHECLAVSTPVPEQTVCRQMESHARAARMQYASEHMRCAGVVHATTHAP